MVILFFISGCTGGSQQIDSYNGFAVLPRLKPGEAVATFAGGCFWAMQESMLQLKGVNTVISGYAGGTTMNPAYDEVLSENTGHAETVQVYYSPSVITYEQLVQAFFYAHDPTQLNRQGPDIGFGYRSVAFYRTPQELKTLGKVIHQFTARRYYPGSIVTSLEPFDVFYPAESSQQDYYEKNLWDPYIRNVSKPKVAHVREELPGLIKAGYLK
jgi:peptide-methionine (S)-S-oxide reductase